MADYIVSATVTSPPTDISLHVHTTKLKMSRDSAGGWAGKAKLDLPDSFAVALTATGLAFAPWTLEIKFATLPPEGKVVKDYKHEDKIPDDLLSTFEDTINLKGTAMAGTVTP